MRKLRNAQGFTLIELMIVVVIIGILAAIALPKFTGMSRTAKEAEADPLLKEVYTLQEAYYTRFAEYATANELKKYGYDETLSDKAAAEAEGRYYWIDLTTTGTEFCAIAKLTATGTQNELHSKTMDETRVITPHTTPGVDASACP